MRKQYPTSVVHLTRHQRGVILIVGLILLFLVTLVGLSGMRDTLLQERMAGNSRDRDMARQSAEAGLRNAESTLASVTAPWTTDAPAVGHWVMDGNQSAAPSSLPRRNSGGAQVSEYDFWTKDPSLGGYDWDNNSTSFTSINSNNTYSKPPQIVIEQLPLGSSKLPGSDNMNYVTDTNTVIELSGSGGLTGVGGPTGKSPVDPSYRVIDYLVTVKATGVSSSATVILQSQYRRVICLKPQGTSCNMKGTCSEGTYPKCTCSTLPDCAGF